MLRRFKERVRNGHLSEDDLKYIELDWREAKEAYRFIRRLERDESSKLDPDRWKGGGVDVGAALTGTIPEPTVRLLWGEDITFFQKDALYEGKTALLLDKKFKPYSIVLMDSYGTIREIDYARFRAVHEQRIQERRDQKERLRLIEQRENIQARYDHQMRKDTSG